MKVKYKCQFDEGKDFLKVTSTFDEENNLYFETRDRWSCPAEVRLSRKQVKKLRKQLKKALET